MNSMFLNAAKFNQDISSWQIAKWDSMELAHGKGMFGGANAFKNGNATAPNPFIIHFKDFCAKKENDHTKSNFSDLTPVDCPP